MEEKYQLSLKSTITSNKMDAVSVDVMMADNIPHLLMQLMFLINQLNERRTEMQIQEERKYLKRGDNDDIPF